MAQSPTRAPLAEDEPIAVVPPDPGWTRRFDSERELLELVLAPWLQGGIHHIGATSVPGLAAKPIVDIMAGVRGLDEARAAFAPLREHSYVHTPHRPGIAHHFSKPSARLRECDYGLHLTEPGSDLWRERLAFRDALRADGALTAEYEALKLQLAREHPRDITAYTAGKRAFVGRVLAGAGIPLGRR
ncbi:MAG TPA: GrpB family protein [Gaiellaceae bacterium]